MDIFLSTRPTGILIGRGAAPETPQVLFPGAGKHLSRVLRLLPPPVSGVIDVPLSLAIDAVVQCLKSPAPDEHVAAFLDCLLPVDKLNVGDPHSVWELAHKLSGDVVGFLTKADVHWMRMDKREFAYRLIRAGKSTWVRVNREKAQKLLRLKSSLDREDTPLKHVQDDSTRLDTSQDMSLDTSQDTSPGTPTTDTTS